MVVKSPTSEIPAGSSMVDVSFTSKTNCSMPDPEGQLTVTVGYGMLLFLD